MGHYKKGWSALLAIMLALYKVFPEDILAHIRWMAQRPHPVVAALKDVFQHAQEFVEYRNKFAADPAFGMQAKDLGPDDFLRSIKTKKWYAEVCRTWGMISKPRKKKRRFSNDDSTEPASRRRKRSRPNRKRLSS